MDTTWKRPKTWTIPEDLRVNVHRWCKKYGKEPNQVLELEQFLNWAFEAGQQARLDAPTVPLNSIDGGPTEAGSLKFQEHTLPLPKRYTLRGSLGAGGEGEVFRVWDKVCQREVALKVVRGRQEASPERHKRFLKEVWLQGRLQHPGIVPVFDVFSLLDGRPCFTQRIVEGRTLSAIIEEVHAHATHESWGETPSGWTFHRLVDAFGRVCEAVAYAHSNGVVHGDLKPSNIMVGGHGNVLVVDWGLARRHTISESGSLQITLDPAQEGKGPLIQGTPAYMAPEQAFGQQANIGPWTDVYALGAVLQTVLTGRAPYVGSFATDILKKVQEEAPLPFIRVVSGEVMTYPTETLVEEPHNTGAGSHSIESPYDDPLLPEELKTLSKNAMERDWRLRPQRGDSLTDGIRAWQERRKRRKEALNLLLESEDIYTQALTLCEESKSLRCEGEALLARLPSGAPVADKHKAWALLKKAGSLELRAERQMLSFEQQLQTALTLDASLPQVHMRLAGYLREAHRRAEKDGDERQARYLAQRLRSHDKDGQHLQYLEGIGKLTLVTNAPGASVEWQRLVVKDQRLCPTSQRILGHSPLVSTPLERGSHILRICTPGRMPVIYPVIIRRLAHWNPEREESSFVVKLPQEGELKADEIYVPGGPAQFGGDKLAANALPAQTQWVDAFVIQKYQVTHGQFVNFLNDLVDGDKEEQALRWMPQERVVKPGKQGPSVYGRRENGHFFLQPDADGDLIHPDWPVNMIDWFSAEAYATWWAEKMQQPWRLCREMEWEKAARGVDGRIWPWGNVFDPTFCCMGRSFAQRSLPVSIHEFPVDESIYGVRGMAGNMREWCEDVYFIGGSRAQGVQKRPIRSGESSMLRAFRGGGWYGDEQITRCAGRAGGLPLIRGTMMGFRLARSY